MSDPQCPYRPGLPPMIDRISRLPVDTRGFPVPYFVQWFDGKPDHRVRAREQYVRCVRQCLCWVCGEPLALRERTFLIGPMCVINTVAAEPPMHEACARWAVQGCPFLSNPDQRRREHHLPAGASISEAGTVRNPGVIALWMTPMYAPIAGPHGEPLLQIGEPTLVQWYTEGRFATRTEVEAAFAEGWKELSVQARQEGPDVVALMERRKTAAVVWLPPA